MEWQFQSVLLAHAHDQDYAIMEKSSCKESKLSCRSSYTGTVACGWGGRRHKSCAGRWTEDTCGFMKSGVSFPSKTEILLLSVSELVSALLYVLWDKILVAQNHNSSNLRTGKGRPKQTADAVVYRSCTNRRHQQAWRWLQPVRPASTGQCFPTLTIS